MKILVIDDDPSIRYRLAQILVKAGYEVVMADDGEHGLALFHQARPDLVICDLIMPYRGGIETVAQIRRESPGMKIIAMSGGGRLIDADALAAALEIGVHDVLVKPFDPDDLLNRLDALVA